MSTASLIKEVFRDCVIHYMNYICAHEIMTLIMSVKKLLIVLIER